MGQLILEYLKTLAWPGVVVTLALVFRSALREMSQRLNEFSAGPVSMKLENKIMRRVDKKLKAFEGCMFEHDPTIKFGPES